MPPSTGTVGDSYDNALAERMNNTYKRELIWINGPYRTVGELEYATMRFVSWYNSKRLHASLGYRPDSICKRNACVRAGCLRL